ncbi:MAG: hypothetical protein WD939_05185 [Dehalococcoidia bacterium]
MAVQSRTLAPPQQRKAAKAWRIGPILAAAGAAIVVIGLLRIVQTSQATTASFAVADLQQEKLELETSVRQMEAEVANLSSLARIERDAARLGLAPAVAFDALTINVAWPEASEALLPTRFAPEESEVAVDDHAGGSAWWEDLLESLPFY